MTSTTKRTRRKGRRKRLEFPDPIPATPEELARVVVTTPAKKRSAQGYREGESNG